MKHKTTMLLLALLSAVVAAGVRLYRGRSRERIPSPEGIDDPEVARAFGWVSRTPHMRLLRRAIVAHVAAMVDRGEAIDLGCGPGDLVLALARRAPALQVTGVDVSAEMLALAEDRARRAGLEGRVAVRLGDAQCIPFPDHSLDLVVSTLSLHHWADPVGVFDEIARVLRPGGSYLIFDLRRDLPAPAWLLLWFASHVVVPRPLKQIGEPMGSRNASYSCSEAAKLAEISDLSGWSVSAGPLWLTIEGTFVEPPEVGE